MKKIIRLQEIEKNIGGLQLFSKLLLSNLGNDVIVYMSKEELLFQILKQISPINKTLRFNYQSIERACAVILKHFSIKTKYEFSKTKNPTSIDLSKKELSHSEIFYKSILRIEKIPFYAYQELSREVSKDLRLITNLIDWYETLECIKKYNSNDEIPKSHEDRTILDFYKRCRKERNEILNFQLNGMLDKAIENSRISPPWMQDIMKLIQKRHDRPYQFADEASIKFFDYRRIDLTWHRLSEFYDDEIDKMYKLYYKNKSHFYKIYFKRKSPVKHFKEFKYYINNLPLIHNRKQIFNELERLYKDKRWIGFYALALPQVEGLFYEMNCIIHDKNYSNKTLSAKANSIRPFHYLSKYYSDYFQYYIPIQRNKFSHFGYIDNFILGSKDLLVDLSYILKIFYELDNPLIKIGKLHARKAIEDFSNIQSVFEYFSLIDNLKPAQRNGIKSEIAQFENIFLSKMEHLASLFFEMRNEIEMQLEPTMKHIRNCLISNNFKNKSNKITITEIDKWLEEENSKVILKNCIADKYDNFILLYEYNYILSNHSRKMPSLKKELKEFLQELENESRESIKIVAYIYNKIHPPS